MASNRKRHGKYQVRVVRKGHQPHTRTFSKRTDAVRWARATEVEIERGATVSGARCPTRDEAIERYMAEYPPGRRAPGARGTCCRHGLGPPLGSAA